MPLTVPAAVNYPTKLVAVPSLMQDEPKEGRKQISVEIDWGTMGGAANAVSFNLQNNTTLEWTQISTLKIDNSSCGADITFVFQDTSDTITIPAYSPYVLVPVFSNAKSFHCVAPNAVDGDITRFQILNYECDPTNIPTSTGQEGSIASGGIPMAISSATVISPAGTSGTVTGIMIGASVSVATVDAVASGAIVDGNGKIFAYATVNVDAQHNFNGVIFQMSNMDLRFEDGLKFEYNAGPDAPDGYAAVWNVNCYFRLSGG